MMTETGQTPPPLEVLLDRVGKEFAVKFEDISLGGEALSLLQIQDMPKYIDKLVAKHGQGGKVSLPLWAKIWPSCLVLARLLQTLDPEGGRTVLDIGAGVGLIGLTAAMRGFNATLMDIAPLALDFCRINAMKNGLAKKVKVVQADFTGDELGERFDILAGCEIFYRPEHIPSLAKFLDSHLKETPGAEIVMAMDVERKPVQLLKIMSKSFAIRSMEVECKMDGEAKTASLFRLRRLDA